MRPENMISFFFGISTAAAMGVKKKPIQINCSILLKLKRLSANNSVRARSISV